MLAYLGIRQIVLLSFFDWPQIGTDCQESSFFQLDEFLKKVQGLGNWESLLGDIFLGATSSLSLSIGSAKATLYSTLGFDSIIAFIGPLGDLLVGRVALYLRSLFQLGVQLAHKHSRTRLTLVLTWQ